MVKWEYHVQGLHGHTHYSNNLIDDLNRLGREGWELVATPTQRDPYHTFKRPITEKVDSEQSP